MSARGGGLAGAALGAIARTLPAHVRGRYREEWLADLAGAEQLELSRASILLGALATAVSIDRDSPAVLGVPVSVEAVRRARWAAACLCAAAVLALGLWWNAGYALDGDISGDVDGGIAAMPAALLAALGSALGVAAGLLAAAGAWFVLRALVVGVEAFGVKRMLLAALAAAGGALAFVGFVFLPFLGLLYGFGMLVTALVLAAGGPRGAAPAQPLSPGRRILLALPFSLATLAVVAVMLLHVFVWNPLAKLPGMSLDQIYAGMRAAGEGTSSGFAVAWSALLVLAALALPVLSATRSLGGPRSSRRILTLGLLLLATAAGSTWIVGFSMGMGMADAFATTGGDAAVSGPLLSILGQLSLVAAIFAGLAPSSRARCLAPPLGCLTRGARDGAGALT